jgi:hypothetical protein
MKHRNDFALLLLTTHTKIKFKMENNLSCFLLYYYVCIREENVLSVETYLGKW